MVPPPKAVFCLALSLVAAAECGVHHIQGCRSAEQFAMPTERIKKNLNGFEKALEVAVHQDGGVQIVVYPEDAILGNGFLTREAIVPYLENIPSIKEGVTINPCKDLDMLKDSPILS